MSRALLIARLAVRDVRRRPAQALLMLLSITAATTVLSLALALHGVTTRPFQQTRAATKGPDVVALLNTGGVFTGPHVPSHAVLARQIQAQARSLISARGVTAHAGLYPVASVILQLGKVAAQVQAEGRDQAPAVLDQPKLTAGSWVRPDGIVLERTFAESLGARVGDRVTLNGRRYTVAGIAVTAAAAPYPNLCFPPGSTCLFDYPMSSNGSRVWVAVGQKQVTLSTDNIGLAWVTEPDARALASSAAPLGYFLDLKLADPATAQEFISAYQAAHSRQVPGPASSGPSPAAAVGLPSLVSWQSIAYNDGLLVQDEQQVLTPGALLLVLLAIASVAVLVGGRMSAQASRVGVLKAIGATPEVVSLALLAENVMLAVSAAAIGLVAGWLAAPLITSPGAALLGAPGAPSMTATDAGLVIGVALLVALASTLVPGIRAARVSTVTSLAEQVRPPRRRPRLIAISRQLPAPLLLGMRVIARRPRRAVLTAASVAVTVAGIVAVLTFHASAARQLGATASAVSDPVVDRDEQMLVVLTVALVTLAVLNALVTAWSTVLETRTSSALTRALGASPRQLGAGLAMAQAVPALPGAVLGIPLGLGLFAAANGGGAATTVIPPAWWLAAAVIGTVLAVLALAAVPARIEQRVPIAPVLTEA